MSDTRKARYNIEDIHSKHASYVKMRAEIGAKPKFNKQIMLLGETWYKIGHKLEDAEIQLQTDASFVSGYERAARIDKINDGLYYLGMEYFEKGTPLVEIPSNYLEKEPFRNGYNEALRLDLQKKNSRH